MKPNYEYTESPAALRVLAILEQAKTTEFSLIVQHHRQRTCRKTARHKIDDEVLKTSFEYLDLAIIAKDFPEFLSDLFMRRLEQATSIKEIKCLVRAQLLSALHRGQGIAFEQPIMYRVAYAFAEGEIPLNPSEVEAETLLMAVEKQLGLFDCPQAY